MTSSTGPVETRDSSEYGWQVIRRAEYDKLVRHDYAGMSDDGTAWVMSMDETGATVLFTGVDVIA